MKKIIFLIIMMFSLSGCYNYSEMNELAIISALGVDYEDETFKTHAQVVEFKDGKENFVTFSSEGKTIYESLRNLSKYSSKRMYISHLEILILSENVFRNHNYDVIDFFSNYPESGLNYYVVVSEESPEDFIKTSTPLNTLSSNSIVEMIKLNNKYESFANVITFDEYIDDYISKGKSLIVPRLHITSYKPSEEKKEEKVIEIKDLIIVNTDKEVNYLNENESIGYSLLTNKGKRFILTIPCPNGKYTIELKSFKTSIEPKNNNTFSIDVSSFGTVGSYDCELTNEKKIEEFIVNSTEEEINKIINETINLSKKNKTDFIGLGNILYAKKYRYFNKIQDDWENKYLEKIKFNITTKVSTNKLGNLKSTLKGSD